MLSFFHHCFFTFCRFAPSLCFGSGRAFGSSLTGRRWSTCQRHLSLWPWRRTRWRRSCRRSPCQPWQSCGQPAARAEHRSSCCRPSSWGPGRARRLKWSHRCWCRKWRMRSGVSLPSWPRQRGNWDLRRTRGRRCCHHCSCRARRSHAWRVGCSPTLGSRRTRRARVCHSYRDRFCWSSCRVFEAPALRSSSFAAGTAPTPIGYPYQIFLINKL